MARTRKIGKIVWRQNKGDNKAGIQLRETPSGRLFGCSARGDENTDDELRCGDYISAGLTDKVLQHIISNKQFACKGGTYKTLYAYNTPRSRCGQHVRIVCGRDSDELQDWDGDTQTYIPGCELKLGCVVLAGKRLKSLERWVRKHVELY